MRALALAAVLLAVSSPAVAQSSVGVITNPDWASIPRGEDLWAAYPIPAQMLEIEGRATVECAVNDLGRLNRCTVVSEGPAEFGFGAGALQLSSKFQMSPRRVDGRPIAGGTVRVPIAFRLPPRPPTPPATGPSPSPEALAAAARLVKAQGFLDQFLKTMPERVEHAERLHGRTVEPKLRAELLSALETGAKARGDVQTQIMARYFAKNHSLEELRAAATFFESPAGQAHARVVWINLRPGPEEQVLMQSWAAEATAAAREAFCRNRDCSMPSAGPPPTAANP